MTIDTEAQAREMRATRPTIEAAIRDAKKKVRKYERMGSARWTGYWQDVVDYLKSHEEEMR